MEVLTDLDSRSVLFNAWYYLLPMITRSGTQACAPPYHQVKPSRQASESEMIQHVGVIYEDAKTRQLLRYLDGSENLSRDEGL